MQIYSELEHLDIDSQRRIAFVVADVADALEIPLIPDVPLKGLLDTLLQEASQSPYKVSPDAFEVLYRLRYPAENSPAQVSDN